MSSRRGSTALTAGLVAVIAILGTTLFFTSNVQLPSLPNLPIGQPSPNAEQPQLPSTTITTDESSPPTTDTPTESETTVDPESIGLSNVHIWVAPDDHASVAAMVVTNQGTNDAAINSISVRGTSVSYSSWYYNKADFTPANINVPLKPDYAPSSIDIDGDGAEETFENATGPILLESGRSVAIYLLNPAYIRGVDAGLAYNVQVKVGEITKVASVSVSTVQS